MSTPLKPRARRLVTEAIAAATAVSLTASALTASVAYAAEPVPAPSVAAADERMATLKAAGDAAMDAGDYAAALRAYREAYAASPQPALVYNMARAEERLGRYADALSKIELFAETAPPELRARVPSLDALITDLRSHVATVTVRSNVPGARVTLRGRNLGATPMRGPVRTSEGKAILEVQADGYRSYHKDVVLEGGRFTTFDVKLTPGAPVPPGPAVADRALSPMLERREVRSEPTSNAITTKWWFWTGIGVGVSVVGGIVLASALSGGHNSGGNSGGGSSPPPQSPARSSALFTF